MLWSEGDCININGATSLPLKAEYDGKAGATFEFKEKLAKPYSIVYPASAYKTSDTVVLPAVQDESAVNGSFGPGADILLGQGSDGKITLHHACAAVKLNILLKDDGDNLAYVGFRGNAGEQVSGIFTANYSNASISATSSAAADQQVRALCSKPATAEGTEVVIVVPAGSYPDGFTVTVVDCNRHVMEKSTTGAKTLAADALTVMPDFEFVPTGTLVDVVIANANDLVQFASDWNSGKFDDKTGFAVSLGGDINFSSDASKAFIATGGIGTAEHPFDALMDGGEYCISGLTSNVPLFGNIAAEGRVKDLRVASTCLFTGCAVLAQKLEGTLENCTVSANLSHSPTLSTDCLVGALASTAAEGSLISGCTNDGTTLVEPTAKALSTHKLYVGGITADLAGTLSGCSNNGKVAVVLKYACKDVRIGGLVASSGNPAIIENCTNCGLVNLDGTAVTGEESGTRSKNTEAWMGGIIGRSDATITLRDCVNTGEINYEFSTAAKVNQRPSSLGGIAGWLAGNGSTITSCVNSGKLGNVNFNNSDAIDLAVTEGGIVAVCIGAGSTISSCKNLGENTIQIQRGVQGGIAGWVENCTKSSCESEVRTVACPSNIPFSQGGIAGKCLSTTIDGCTARGVYLCCKTTAATSAGCIAGSIDGTSKITGCTIINGRLARNAADNFTAGAIAGKVTEATGEISGCKVDAYKSIDSGSTWTALDLSKVSGSGTFVQNAANTLNDIPYNIAGHVRCGTTPLANVVVSDGFQSVRTDADGFFSMKSDLLKVHAVSVSVPQGYSAPRVDGLPKFYTIVNGTPNTSISFSLEQISGNPDDYTMIFSADPQPRSSTAGYDKIGYHSLDCSKDLYMDIGETANDISGEQVYGIVLGDVVHENMSLYDTHCNNLKNYCSSMSTYHAIGNHDYNTSAANMAAGAVDFEKHFGPTRYSMNLGKFHYVVLDDLIMNYSGGKLQGYDNGLSDDVYKWLVSDLKYVSFSTPIVICTHGPMYVKHNGGTSRSYVFGSAVNGANYTKLLSRYSKVYAFAGHIHNNFTFIFNKEKTDEEYCKNVENFTLARSSGPLWLNEYVNGDGSPRGYLVMKARGTSLSWKYTPAVHQTGSFAASGYSMPSYTYRDWKYVNGVAKIGSAELADSYQMKVYPDVTFNDKNYMMANIFFWDALWGTPTLQYTTDSGDRKSVNMSRWGISSKPYDFAYNEIYTYYAEKNSNWRSEHLESDGSLGYPSICPHMFRCAVPTDGHKGNVVVTDRFGNTYTSEPMTW